MLIMVNLCDFDLFELLDNFLRLGTFDIDLKVKVKIKKKQTFQISPFLWLDRHLRQPLPLFLVEKLLNE